MTFRTASSSQYGSGKWERKATPGVHIFRDAQEYAKEQLETLADKKLKDIKLT